MKQWVVQYDEPWLIIVGTQDACGRRNPREVGDLLEVIGHLRDLLDYETAA